MSLKFMLDRADALGFLIPRSGSWNVSAAVSEQTERTQDQYVSSHAFVFTCGLDSKRRRLERMESELLTSSSTRLQQRAEPLGSPVSGVLVSFGPNLFCATLTARMSYSGREKPTVWLLSSSPSDCGRPKLPSFRLVLHKLTFEFASVFVHRTQAKFNTTDSFALQRPTLVQRPGGVGTPSLTQRRFSGAFGHLDGDRR